MIDFKSQSARTLLALAGGRTGIDAARCALVFAHLGTAERLRRCLRSAVARHQLSDLQFAALVVLLALEPEPIPTAVLAEHTAVSRSAMTDALDKLEALGFATRTRDRRDRRVIYVRITLAGRETVDEAIDNYLRAAADTARYLDAREHRGLFAAYLQLQRGVTGPDEPVSRCEANAS